jgi:hypothetical protein
MFTDVSEENTTSIFMVEFTLKIEAACSSETLKNIYPTTRVIFQKTVIFIDLRILGIFNL